MKIKLRNYFWVLMVLSVFGCLGTPTNTAEGVDLDTAVKELAALMNAKLPQGTKVALISVASPSSAFSEQVLLRLESALVSSGKLVIVDRANLDKVRAEQGFHLSGDVDDDSATAIGKMLGAGAIVTGSTADLGDVYGLALKTINTETAMVAVSYLADLAKTKRINTLMASGGGASGGQRTAQSSGGTTKSPGDPVEPSGPVVYKIGGRGQAGGFIFYDKGNDSGGWRYLEAAPAVNEFKAIWGEIRSVGIKDEVGSGKANTEAIVSALQQAGLVSGAARSCARLNINGYTDWFLPSKDELYWMYVNLKEEGIGGFSGDWYWSSSRSNNNNNGHGVARQFSDGRQEDISNRDTCSVRAVRAF